MFIHEHSTNWRASCAPLYELSFAPSPHHGDPVNAHPARQSQSKAFASTKSMDGRTRAIGAPSAVPSIAARAGKTRRAIATDRDRRAQDRDVLSRGPVRARSTGDFDSQDANQNTALGA